MAGVAPCNVPLLARMRGPLSIEPLFPDRGSGEPLAVQLARRLRVAIDSGAIPARTKMLGSRELAKRLGLGRNTVALAFEQLTAEGYFETRRGSGTFVALPLIKRHRVVRTSVDSNDVADRRSAALRAHFGAAAGRGPLRPGMPFLPAFPSNTWKRCAREALSVFDRYLGYEPAYGTSALRGAIAQHVHQFRGIGAEREQIIVVEGAQAAMHLAALVLTKAGDAIAIEDPCYALACAAFNLLDLRLRPVAVDEEGLRTDALTRHARCAFVTPTHQFPLGGTLPLARRLQLLEWARERDAYVLEDDYDSEFTNRMRPLPALQSLDRHERVVYIGSFSKTLSPALRVGFLIVPPHLARAFRAARASSSLGVSLHLQETLAHFINRGHFARYLRRMNARYDRKRTILARALEPLSGRGYRLGPTQVGLHFSLRADRKFDDRALAVVDDDHRVLALSSLCVERKDCFGFALGFTNGTDDEIAQAAERFVLRVTCGKRKISSR